MWKLPTEFNENTQSWLSLNDVRLPNGRVKCELTPYTVGQQISNQGPATDTLTYNIK